MDLKQGEKVEKANQDIFLCRVKLVSMELSANQIKAREPTGEVNNDLVLPRNIWKS